MDQDTIGILASIFDHFQPEAQTATDENKPTTELWRQIDTAVRRAHTIQKLDHDLTVEPRPDINECLALFLASTGAKVSDRYSLQRRTVNPRLDQGPGTRNAYGANIEGVICVDFVSFYPNIILRLCATGDIRIDRDLAHVLFVLKHRDAVKAALSGDGHALNLYINFLFGMLPIVDKVRVGRVANKVTAGLMAATQHIVSNIDEHYFLVTPGLVPSLRDRVGLLHLPFETTRLAGLVLLAPSRYIALKGDCRIRGLPRLDKTLRQTLGGT